MNVLDNYKTYSATMQDTFPDTTYDFTEVIPGLYISDMYLAQDMNGITSRNIKSIINVTEDAPTPFEDISYLRIPIKDNVTVNISDYFNQTCDFIEEGLKQGSVLVHCGHGISRAPTIVAAYLIRKYKMTYEAAVEKIRETRHGIDPNFSFCIALLTFARQVSIN
jgi:protein-tyrosine phosphatase